MPGCGAVGAPGLDGLLIMHGEHDPVIPIRFGRELLSRGPRTYDLSKSQSLAFSISEKPRTLPSVILLRAEDADPNTS